VDEGATYTIGQFAAAAGVHTETVRYYERRGLLRAPRRSAAGYRLYDDADLRLMELIARGKQLGFTLAEISELVGGDGTRSVDSIRSAAQAKAADIAARQRELAAVRDRLRRLAELCVDGADADADCLMLRVAR
jgi:MerR family Zn(II)-responsive transcriptional regulator of zntA